MGSPPIHLACPTANTTTQSRQASSNSAMNHLTASDSVPLNHTRTSKDHASTQKSRPGTSSFSLKDKLKSFRQKATPSSSTTHHVTLNGLKSDSQARGMSYFLLQHARTNLTRPQQTCRRTSPRTVKTLYSRLHSETFVPVGYNTQRVLAFVIVDTVAPRDGHLCDDHLPITP